MALAGPVGIPLSWLSRCISIDNLPSSNLWHRFQTGLDRLGACLTHPALAVDAERLP